ncbi:MAG TPA: hypothetical protein VKQ11_05335 [Candidatus Sulfotelmatobacter sp.]|nr:hypothetical protein [Candidatus Sulfotelmatobacter sp.]
MTLEDVVTAVPGCHGAGADVSLSSFFRHDLQFQFLGPAQHGY